MTVENMVKLGVCLYICFTAHTGLHQTLPDVLQLDSLGFL